MTLQYSNWVGPILSSGFRVAAKLAFSDWLQAPWGSKKGQKGPFGAPDETSNLKFKEQWMSYYSSYFVSSAMSSWKQKLPLFVFPSFIMQVLDLSPDEISFIGFHSLPHNTITVVSVYFHHLSVCLFECVALCPALRQQRVLAPAKCAPSKAMCPWACLPCP